MTLNINELSGIPLELRAFLQRDGAVGVPVALPVNAVASTLTTTMGIANAEILYTAVTRGVAGNAITIRYANPGVINSPLAVTVTDSAIVVSIATDGAGALVSTGTEVRNAVNANVAAAALVLAANTGTGAGVINAAKAVESLVGGVNGTPARVGAVLVSGTRIYTCPAGNTINGANWLRSAESTTF